MSAIIFSWFSYITRQTLTIIVSKHAYKSNAVTTKYSVNNLKFAK